MKTLCRTEASGYPLEMAHTLAELEAMTEEERRALVIPTEDIFRKYPAVTLSPFFSRLAHSGLEIYARRIQRIPRSGYLKERPHLHRQRYDALLRPSR